MSTCPRCGHDRRLFGPWRLCGRCGAAALATERENRYADQRFPRRLSHQEMMRALARAGMENDDAQD